MPSSVPADRTRYTADDPGIRAGAPASAADGVGQGSPGCQADIGVMLSRSGQQANGAHRRERGARRQRFPHEEFGRPVWQYPGDQYRPFGLGG
jgi:hypothetical protein